MISSREDGYTLSTDPARVDLDLVHHWLSTDAFWALGRSREKVETAARNSLNLTVHDAAGAQVAYARVVTDHATFAWLCDVYVSPAHRGVGLGTWLAQAVRAHLEPCGLTRVLLSTRDAHAVYARAGFVPYPDPDGLMVLTP
ncbi:GNAT family N-acetyltransferase [Streptomyces xanthii]|uniref:GNAT family N-acetyltransferase n=1 Tax=Streptomyces xanthii TaxID=2768069 RepID=A0A7H1B139_9ACTN|nr:GNAT family N-acetyltransferase [Streptomyces xanthii]QNS02444.1 GNAT family N-acetyltransferase [Streptomyces xanthii]